MISVAVTPGQPPPRIELGTGKSHWHSLFAVVEFSDRDPGDELLAYDRALQLQRALSRALEQTEQDWLWQAALVGSARSFAVWCCMKGNR